MAPPSADPDHPSPSPPPLSFVVDGTELTVRDEGSSLLDVLREHLGKRSVKDGCSPQGQCGCCTVWVDGAARIACVTPARRVAGRRVTTLEGLAPEVRDRWARAFVATGASQCGFCTPGIIMRLAALEAKGSALDDERVVSSALLAHLCRCTGWRTMFEAAAHREWEGADERDLEAATERAALEGGSPQAVGTQVALGGGGFADDLAPSGALVAVPDRSGGFCVAESLSEARARTGNVQGRNTTVAPSHPLEVPPGDWAITLRTTFVEPAYVEPDASWCLPGEDPASPLGNGGAFGGKVASDAPRIARLLADEHGRAVRVLFTREDVVRKGPKRPPIAAGLRRDGTGLALVARTPGSADLTAWARAFRSVLPRVDVEEVDVAGPPVSAELRAAGWAEAAVLAAALEARLEAGASREDLVVVDRPVTVVSHDGARASAAVSSDGSVSVRLDAGRVLDPIVLRSYVLGAVHQALGWVRSEGVAVGRDGAVLDLTIRSFGIISAKDMPNVTVEIEEPDPGAPAVRGSDAVFAAVAAAAWLAGGLAPQWPLGRVHRHSDIVDTTTTTDKNRSATTFTRRSP